jgi:excisionase family DNA binding protein
MNNNEVMSIKQLASYLGISESTIRKLIKCGEIPFVKIKRRYLFYKPIIEKWLVTIATSVVSAGESPAVKYAESKSQELMKIILNER